MKRRRERAQLLAPLVRFYGIPPREFRAMTLAEFDEYQKFALRVIESNDD